MRSSLSSTSSFISISNYFQKSTFYRNAPNNRLRVEFSSSISAIPRAAVSVIVRSANNPPSFVLVQRGKEPNLGKWSLPGGSLEWGERTLDGAKRELYEECQLDVASLQWYEEGAIAVTDSIHYQNIMENGNDCQVDLSSGMVVYHYVIAQCFALAPMGELPLVPSDDAMDANWFQIDEIQAMSEQNETTPGVLHVLDRAERLYQRGCLWEHDNLE
jgi:8-oxo-dGTP diphosphatase